MNQPSSQRIKIKIMMLERGVTFAAIGRSLTPQVSGQAVSNVVKGVDNQPWIQRAIARRLGVKVRDIFPDYRPARKRVKKVAS